MSEPLTIPERPSLNGIPSIRKDDDILEVSPLHKEVCNDLWWAWEQYYKGILQPHAGKYIGIVDKSVLSASYDIGEVFDEAAVKAGVVPARVAVFFVDDGRDLFTR